MLRDCKECAGIKNSVGLRINEETFINSSLLLGIDSTDCMKDAKKYCQVLYDLNRRAYHDRHHTIMQCIKSMYEISEYDEPPPKKQRNSNANEPPPLNNLHNSYLQPTHRPL